MGHAIHKLSAKGIEKLKTVGWHGVRPIGSQGSARALQAARRTTRRPDR